MLLMLLLAVTIVAAIAATASRLPGSRATLALALERLSVPNLAIAVATDFRSSLAALASLRRSR